MVKVLIIIKSSIREGPSAVEGLRLAAAMIGMDQLPNLIFLGGGVELLLPGGVEGEPLEYLKAIAALAGVKALRESIEGLGLEALNPELRVEAIDMDMLADLALESDHVLAI